MKLTIASLKGIDFDGDAASFTVKTTSGEITILDHHRPLVTILSRSTAIITTSVGAKKELLVKGGFLEMSPRNQLRVLVD